MHIIKTENIENIGPNLLAAKNENKKIAIYTNKSIQPKLKNLPSLLKPKTAKYKEKAARNIIKTPKRILSDIELK